MFTLYNIQKIRDSQRPSVQFEIDKKAEAKLRLKIDLMILPTVSLLFLFCFIDKSNIGNARIAGFEADLGLRGYDFNIVLSAFYASYITFEFPATILCKKLGPGWFIPATTFLFGLTSICTAFTRNRAEVAAARFFLGIFESGVLPGIAYYLSRWYRRSELAFRLAIYMSGASLAGAFGGLFASAILTLDSFGGLYRWRILFAIEGIITCLVGIIGLLILTDRPESARWLTEEEKKLAIFRVQSEMITEVRGSDSRRKVILGILNPMTITCGILLSLTGVAVIGLAFFLPTIIKTAFPGETMIQQQLRTVPPNVFALFMTIAIPWISTKLKRRLVLIVTTVPLAIVGYVMFLAPWSGSLHYAATFMIAAGTHPIGPLLIAQISGNVVSDSARAAAIGFTMTLATIGGLLSTWTYLPFDAPAYRLGNGLNLLTTSLVLVITLGVLIWVTMDNMRREAREREVIDLQSKSVSEVKFVEEMEWKHPAFRWSA
ncbi:MFS general substrate transporter [Marasmius fiardii PR-910]|nr:MFS general substrate transporter [Marasmius fiardii PR-910]